MKENKKIIIVGAGMAGLTAAAYLARDNHSVLLLDKNNRVGGLVNSFVQEGFSFDTGPRAFVNSGIVQPVLRDLGIDWDFLGNRISIGIEDQLFQVDTLDSLREYERILKDLYPDHVRQIEKIISTIFQLSGYTKILYEFDNPNFVNFRNDTKFIFRKLIPWTFKFLNALRKFNQFKMPMEEYLGQLTDNQSIIDILTQFFFRKMPAYFALGYFYVYLDYFYPRGGTGALPDLLRRKILDWGGEITLNKRIVKVNPSESKVIDSDGNAYYYDHLIWAADLKTLYRVVDPSGLDEKAVRKLSSQKQKLLASKGAESVFILFLAVDLPPAYFRVRGGEHLFYSPSRKGLGETNRSAREELAENIDRKSREEIFAWLDEFCSLNTYEISVPVLRDPTLAPEGKTGIMISCLFDYNLIENIEKAGLYDEFKKTLENRVIKMLSRTIYQGLEDAVLFKFSSSPLTINKVSGSSEGAITGWSFETEVPVINRLKDIPKSVLTSIPGVLQAGQWAYAPAGVPIAMLTGWYATREIVKAKNKMS